MQICVFLVIFFKNAIVSFFLIKFQNGAHLKKGIFLTYFSHFLVTREKTQKFLQHISHLLTYTHRYFAHPIDFICPPKFVKNVRLLILIPIRALLEQSIDNKMVSKI